MNRKQAEQQYRQAVAIRRALESATLATITEQEFNAKYAKACENEASARSALVEAEINEPTITETRRAQRSLYMRNRGYDF